MELIKPWNDGGNLSVSYDGDGDGSAIFSSDSYEGIDREMPVRFIGGDAIVERIVRQEGIRQPIGLNGGGIFRVLGGGRFGVLKSNGEPIETYTRLTYIESTGKQYINTGYVVQEDDIIEMYYITTTTTSADKAMFGVADSGNGIWATIYSNTSYLRFGSTSSVTISNARTRYKITLKKNSAVIDELTATPVFDTMPTIPLYVFASNNNNRAVNMYGYCQSMGFKISKSNGNAVINMKPCKRDSDGKIGMLDVISGQFYASEGSEEFIGGNEIRITEDYEVIDRVSCNKDKRFDTGFYGNNTTSIDVMFQRTLVSSAAYLFGVTSGSRLTGYLSSGSGSWRYGDGNPTFTIATLNKIYRGIVTPGKTTIDDLSKTFSVDEFTTSYTLPLAGYKASSNTITKHFVGFLYYFRMWHGDTLLLDWHPCRRISDGVEGFWDCVTQTFVEPIS